MENISEFCLGCCCNWSIVHYYYYWT